MSSITDDVERAADLLAAGGLVAFPTETVYGLGADASDSSAVGRIFAVKGRPTDHPVIVHLADGGDLDRWGARISSEARVLAEAFWPGPLTVLVQRTARVPDAVTGGRATVGLRVPDHPVAHELLVAFGARRPDGAAIAAPSANRFGRVSPTTAAHVLADLGDDVDLILDGGPCTVGIESTIVDCTGPVPEVLRLGGISIDRLTHALGVAPRGRSERQRADEGGAADAPIGARAPGMLASHYAPRARVEVIESPAVVAERAAELAARGLVVVVIAPGVLDGLRAEVIELEPAGPAHDYAHVLYDRLAPGRPAGRRRHPGCPAAGG